MIEVFKTNVNEVYEAEMLLNKIRERYKNYIINFDLEDCDKILRVESTVQFNVDGIIQLIRSLGFSAEILQDTIF